VRERWARWKGELKGGMTRVDNVKHGEDEVWLHGWHELMDGTAHLQCTGWHAYGIHASMACKCELRGGSAARS
jgi:hypothetical protein